MDFVTAIFALFAAACFIFVGYDCKRNADLTLPGILALIAGSFLGILAFASVEDTVRNKDIGMMASQENLVVNRPYGVISVVKSDTADVVILQLANGKLQLFNLHQKLCVGKFYTALNLDNTGKKLYLINSVVNCDQK